MWGVVEMRECLEIDSAPAFFLLVKSLNGTKTKDGCDAGYLSDGNMWSTRDESFV